MRACMQDESYLRIARNIQATLDAHNKVACGFTGVRNVNTGELPIALHSVTFRSIALRPCRHYVCSAA